MAVVVSGMPASGKTTVARALAKNFSLEYCAGGDVLKAMAIERGYDAREDDWWDTSQGMAFLKERKKNPEFDREVDKRLLKLVKEKPVVVTSYTLPWLTEHAIKIWLKASPERRAERMAKRDEIGYSEAIKIVLKRDQENKRLYRKLYRISFGTDLSKFDLMINTDLLSTASVIRIVSETLSCFYKG